MSKVPYTKLGLTKNDSKEKLQWGQVEIEIKQYLPFEDKLHLIERIVNKSLDDKGYINPCRRDLFEKMEIFYVYTNVNFTDKQKEDEFKLYDMLVGNGLMEKVISLIPEEEINSIFVSVHQLIDSIYEYRNSARGIMEMITSDYSNLELDAENLQKNIANPENLQLLRDVLERLG